jgi:hypothetical protein
VKYIKTFKCFTSEDDVLLPKNEIIIFLYGLESSEHEYAERAISESAAQESSL